MWEDARPNRLVDPDIAIDVFRVPMALGANRDGVDQGAAALDEALRRRLDTRGYPEILGRLRPSVDIPVAPLGPDRGDEPNAWHAAEIAAACAALADGVAESVGSGRMALVLGGDHALAVGSLAGAGVAGRLGVIWVDAHGDMNTPETSPSGNIHGMPLAVAMGLGEKTLVELADSPQMVDGARAAVVGLRDVDPAERHNIKETGIGAYTMRDIDERGMRHVMEDAIKRASTGTAGIHVSFDVDGIDPDFAPGVGTPSPGGISLISSSALATRRKYRVSRRRPRLGTSNSSRRLARAGSRGTSRQTSPL